MIIDKFPFPRVYDWKYRFAPQNKRSQKLFVSPSGFLVSVSLIISPFGSILVDLENITSLCKIDFFLLVPFLKKNEASFLHYKEKVDSTVGQTPSLASQL